MEMNRKSFVKLAAGAMGVSAFGELDASQTGRNVVGTAGKPWRGWKPGEFQVHFIYTGVAESIFMIFPAS